MKFWPRIVLSVLGNAGLFYFLDTAIFPGKFIVNGDFPQNFLILGVFFTILNFIVKPLLNLVTLPIRWLTMGVFQFAVNGLMVYFLEQKVAYFPILNTTLDIEGGIFTYLLVGLVVALVNGVLHWFQD